MKGAGFWVVFLMLSSASSQRFVLVDITEEKDITEVNENLTDDILLAPDKQRSSITDTDLLWESPVPYILHEDLELNAKGIILRAFDQFRLKTCIDFTVRDEQDYFLHVKKLGGCFSYIGQLFWAGGQPLSIGQYCDEISTVEHEFMHAFGFYHEQSRPDRNHFVTIVYKNILEGRENNFGMRNDSSTQGVSYDYYSVMHYGKNAFTNGNGSTIVTKDPEFQDVIGQRQAMSPKDVKEINLLYRCNDSIAFKLHCGFSDEAMCHMTHCSNGRIRWERVTQAEGGPTSDHTSLPSVTKTGLTPEPSTEGHFMHVSTSAGEPGDSAWLESTRIKPMRDGHIQCLQFYYFHNGSADDLLNVWVREFTNKEDKTGTLHLMGQVTGPPTSQWRIHHVSLDPKEEFQVEFEVQKGDQSSPGGISIDDVNLAEIQCPHVTIQIDDFEHVMRANPYSTNVFSPRHYTSDGYAFRFAVEMNRYYFGLRFQFLSGQYDDKLTWPCLNRQVTLQAVDQTPNIQQHMSKQRSFTTDTSLTTDNGTSVWDNPRKFGVEVEIENGEKVFAGPLIGRGFFWYLDSMKTHDFLKGESAVFAFDFQDISPLINGNSLPKSKLSLPTIKHEPKNPRRDSCTSRKLTTAHPATDKRTTHTTTRKSTNGRTARTTIHKTTHGRTPHTVIHKTTDGRTPHTKIHKTTHHRTPHTKIHKTTAGRTTMIPKTTDDKSIFGFSPVMMSSPILILLSAILLCIA